PRQVAALAKLRDVGALCFLVELAVQESLIDRRYQIGGAASRELRPVLLGACDAGEYPRQIAALAKLRDVGALCFLVELAVQESLIDTGYQLFGAGREQLRPVLLGACDAGEYPRQVAALAKLRDVGALCFLVELAVQESLIDRRH